MTKTVVVTGFGPFGQYESNPSTDVVKRLCELQDPLHDVHLVTDLMSVEYDEVNEKVHQYWKEHCPDLIIHIGVHHIRKTIKLEQQSFGLGYCRYDIKGCVPINNQCPIVPEPEISSTIDCRRIAEKIDSEFRAKCPRLRVERSDDPGRYLCGFSYYISLCHDKSKSLFVHIPEFDEEVTLEVVVDAVLRIVEEILKSSK